MLSSPVKLPVHVMVVDDDPLIPVRIWDIMRVPPPVDVHLIHALEVDSALKMAAADPPDVILLDLAFVGEGKSTTADETIARIPELTPFAPVIILTGFGSDARWREARQRGARDFLLKEAYLNVASRAFFIHAIMNAALFEEPVECHAKA